LLLSKKTIIIGLQITRFTRTLYYGCFVAAPPGSTGPTRTCKADFHRLHYL